METEEDAPPKLEALMELISQISHPEHRDKFDPVHHVLAQGCLAITQATKADLDNLKLFQDVLNSAAKIIECDDFMEGETGSPQKIAAQYMRCMSPLVAQMHRCFEIVSEKITEEIRLDKEAEDGLDQRLMEITPDE